VRNRIYAYVFDAEWAENHLPDAEKRRQAAAYRRGVQRTLAIAGIVFSVLIGLTAFAFKQRNERADALKEVTKQKNAAIVSKMPLLPLAMHPAAMRKLPP